MSDRLKACDCFWVKTYTPELVSHQLDVSEISSHHYESSWAAFEDLSLKVKKNRLMKSDIHHRGWMLLPINVYCYVSSSRDSSLSGSDNKSSQQGILYHTEKKLSEMPRHLATLKCQGKTLVYVKKDLLSAFLCPSSTFSYSSISPLTSAQPFFLHWEISVLSFSNFSILWKVQRFTWCVTHYYKQSDFTLLEQLKLQIDMVKMTCDLIYP